MTDMELEKLHPQRREKFACFNPDAQSHNTYNMYIYMSYSWCKTWSKVDFTCYVVGREEARECNTITANPLTGA